MIHWEKATTRRGSDWYWYEESYGPLTITEELFRKLKGELYGAEEELETLPYHGTMPKKYRINDLLWNSLEELYAKDLKALDEVTTTSPPPSLPQAWFERKTGK